MVRFKVGVCSRWMMVVSCGWDVDQGSGVKRRINVLSGHKGNSNVSGQMTLRCCEQASECELQSTLSIIWGVAVRSLMTCPTGQSGIRALLCCAAQGTHTPATGGPIPPPYPPIRGRPDPLSQGTQPAAPRVNPNPTFRRKYTFLTLSVPPYSRASLSLLFVNPSSSVAKLLVSASPFAGTGGPFQRACMFFLLLLHFLPIAHFLMHQPLHFDPYHYSSTTYEKPSHTPLSNHNICLNDLRQVVTLPPTSRVGSLPRARNMQMVSESILCAPLTWRLPIDPRLCNSRIRPPSDEG